MSVPAHLNSSYRTSGPFLVTDVGQIIAEFRNEVLNLNVPAWTEPEPNEFRSPADAAGRFFTVCFSVVSATQLRMEVRDGRNFSMCYRQVQILAAGSIVEIFSGQFHMHMNVFMTPDTSNQEFLNAGILDESPMPLNYTPFHVYGHGSRQWTSGSIENNYFNYAYMGHNSGYLTRDRILDAEWAPYYCDGSPKFSPCMMWHYEPSPGIETFAGRMYQHFIGPKNANNQIVEIPIAPGVTGKFKQVISPGSNNYAFYVRVG